MQITTVCDTNLYAIRYVEFKSRLTPTHFELIDKFNNKCIGIYDTLSDAQVRMKELTERHHIRTRLVVAAEQ